MRVDDAKLREFEGLVFKTSVIYSNRLRLEREDLQQVLRLRVWLAIRSYDPGVRRASLRSYVFTCVRNQIKDLVKARTRRDALATEFYLEDALVGDGGAFEARHLAEEIGDHLAEEVQLPSSLTADEREVLALLYLGYDKQVDIASALGVRRPEVSLRMSSLKTKLRAAGWRGTPLRTRSDAEIIQLSSEVRERVLQAA